VIGWTIVLGGFVVLRTIFIISSWLIGGTCPPSCATCAIARFEHVPAIQDIVDGAR
jgi:hypothetical protein